MSQELFYTSAPRGLQPGSTGFCTVAETRGLSALLRERLEDLSGYRELFPPHDPRAGQNPVAWSHSRLTVQGKTVSVLSRVGAAGIDHSQRTNKFAHHVVLDAREQVAAGPAALLARPGFLETTWDGQVRSLPTGRPVPAFDVPPAPCVGWQRATGDAGWAGALVEAYLNNRPAYVLYPLGLDPLPLLVEALALLPPERRWLVTFTTYFTALPSGSACAWRCLPLESPGAAEALRAPGAVVLRLDGSQGPAPAGMAVDAARTGQSITVGPPGLPPTSFPLAGRPPAPRFEQARLSASTLPRPGLESSEPMAPADAGSLPPELVELAPVRPSPSAWAGFPVGMFVGFLMAALVGVGVWLGVGLHANGGPAAATSAEGREAEVNRKIAGARNHWEEKDLPLAVEKGRKERSEEVKKDVKVASNCREVLPSLIPDLTLATLEDPAALKKTLSARMEASKGAQEEGKIARNCKDILPEIFPTFNKATLADGQKFKEELVRVRKLMKEDAAKEAVFERETSLAKALSVVQFYFGYDAQAVRDMESDQLLANVQTRYQDMLKDEQLAELELARGNTARKDYKLFLDKRMDTWRENVKMGVRSKADLRVEAEETRKRLGLETRPDKNDPLLQRTVTFDLPTTWVIDYFEALEHYDFVLKKSRRVDLRERAQKSKAELIKMRQSALEELDKYLKSPR